MKPVIKRDLTAGGQLTYLFRVDYIQQSRTEFTWQQICLRYRNV